MGSEGPWCFLKPSDGSWTAQCFHALRGATKILVGRGFTGMGTGKNKVAIFVVSWRKGNDFSCSTVMLTHPFLPRIPPSTPSCHHLHEFSWVCLQKTTPAGLDDCWSHRRRAGEGHRNIIWYPLFLPTTCIQFCPNCTRPQGSAIYFCISAGKD